MKTHMIPFATTQRGDRELIELAFSKKKADERKEWLRQFKVHRVHNLALTLRPEGFFAAWDLLESQHRRDPTLGLYQPRTHPLLHGGQYSVHSLCGGWPQARSTKGHMGLLQAEVEERDQGLF
jgi:hypothetical protein